MTNRFKAAELKLFARFVLERERIRVRKEAGHVPPWTKDPVLATYRFCNVRRNDDRESRLIHEHWLAPHSREPDVWFAMVVARLVNWWPSLAEIGYPVPWMSGRFVAAMDGRRERGEKVFTGAYMIHADAHHGGTKAAYLAERVLQPMWDARKELRPKEGDTLDAFHKRLVKCRDMGSFMAGQVVADTKYADGPLGQAPDFMTWATSGPGSMKGLSWVEAGHPDAKWTEQTWRAAFAVFQNEVAPYLKTLGPITGQDLQNCLCEYSKWRRGTSRSKYQPKQRSIDK